MTQRPFTSFGLRERLFLIIAATLAGLYVIGLYLSAQDLQRNFEREYIVRANILASALDATVSTSQQLDPAIVQTQLARLKESDADILKAQLYTPKDRWVVISASTDEAAIGTVGDADDTQPLLSNRIAVAERVEHGKKALEFNVPLHQSETPVAVLGVYIDLAGRDELVRNQLVKFAGLGALAILIIGAVLYANLQRAVVRPIGKLVGASSALAAGAQGVLVEVDGARGEMQELISSFNTMAHSLAVVNAEQRALLERMRHLYFDSIQALVAALDARDHYTKGHSNNVSQLSATVATVLGLSAGDVEKIRFAGLLHDIGKIGVPDRILHQRQPLDDHARGIVRNHSALGASILEQAEHLADLAPLVRHHHERYDGGGYPDGLRDSEIPFGARILCAADAYDAMTSNRSYRPALGQEAAIAELLALRGKQFDPTVVDALLKTLVEDKGVVSLASSRLS